MALSRRKKQIMKIVVDSYINTAEPVGSKAIADQLPEKVSSATVRKDLADLSDMGYLEQPHTSAGRIPSAKGYRLYVNELMDRKPLSAEEEASINTALAKPLQQVEQVIDQAGQMVSSFVGYPTYTVADHRTAATVQRFELIAVDAGSFIAVVMLSDNRVKSQLMRASLPVEAEMLPQLSHLLNTHFTGVSAEEMNATLMHLSEQVSGQWFLILNQVTEYAGSLLEESNHQQVYTSGASQLLKFPEFRDIDKAHDLMSFMVDNKEDLPVPQSDAPLLLEKARAAQIRTSVETDASVRAPVAAGQQLGRMTVTAGDETVAEIPLVAPAEIPARTFPDLWAELLGKICFSQ